MFGRLITAIRNDYRTAAPARFALVTMLSLRLNIVSVPQRSHHRDHQQSRFVRTMGRHHDRRHRLWGYDCVFYLHAQHVRLWLGYCSQSYVRLRRLHQHQHFHYYVAECERQRDRELWLRY